MVAWANYVIKMKFEIVHYADYVLVSKTMSKKYCSNDIQVAIERKKKTSG